MEWQDEGIVLSVRTHGETSAIADVFCRSHGRYGGLIKGGRSRRMRPVLQIGNHVDATWSARLADHLGNFRLELNHGYAATAMESPLRLAALSSMCTLLHLLPERDPHPSLYEVSMFVLGFLDDDSVWPALLVRWELALLQELGFGLDLSKCAATGKDDDLAFVSPKSGRAVSATAGAPYADRLLVLPEFLVAGRGTVIQKKDVLDGFSLLGYFLEKHFFAPKGERLPEARSRLVGLVQRQAE